MANDGISVPYNHDLKSLETLLSGVRRPGDFFAQGSLEAPMPRVEIEGVGLISFPVPETQVQRMVQQATRAPYGRGEDTVHDESVRKTWQVPASQVRIGGKSWEKTFSQLLAAVVDGLGCAGAGVTAELYKLLVYEPGGFFAAHRDTEKTDGMFATLVVMLPSAHRGGELVIRHAGREIVADLSSEEFSELKFAAFYADCQHEVRPVTEGHRVCLVYNLIQPPGRTPEGSLQAPLYSSEIETASGMLKAAFEASGAPAKLAWLLGHQYSPSGLSFAGLKGEDAALAKVLRVAAERAGCAVHLGIVHIEETGAAQPDYEDDFGYGRYGRGRSYDEEDASSDSFEVIEVSDASRHIDQWVNARDETVAYGQLPLEDGEVLPAGALDDEEPDEQRLTEATGNEGVSFERAYHRAALVIWPRDRFARILLQAGVTAALPHLRDRLAAGDTAAAAIAEQIIEVWEQPPTARAYRSPESEQGRAELLRLLGTLGDRRLLERFIAGVVAKDYDGSENTHLAAAIQPLSPSNAGRLLSAVVGENMPLFHCACVNLLSCVIRKLGADLDSKWQAALRETATIIVRSLPAITPPVDSYTSPHWWRAQKAKPVDAAMLADLLDALRALEAGDLRMEAASAALQNPAAFDPGAILVPALTLLADRARDAFSTDLAAGRIWAHAAEFLLARSERPPAPPTDWRQNVDIPCRCEDCRELQKFVSDPAVQVARFRVRQDRRQHLHQQIERHSLDMTHVTERKGSPQTLVCTKTRRTFQRQCEQHRADCASMNKLLGLRRPVTDALAGLAGRLAAAKGRGPLGSYLDI
jgi:predicted 2-oxoglutarate/Fe(II)-dependent dioxygenase YbiX